MRYDEPVEMFRYPAPSIERLPGMFDVSALLAQIAAHPEVWDTHTLRTDMYGTPHGAISDIWVRYNAWENYTGDRAAFHEPHVSTWYPVCDVLTEAKPLVQQIAAHLGLNTIGGILITRVPPGGRVEPHIDNGWHAQYYSKFAVQLQGNADQAFCFEDSQLSAKPGELYTFDNSRLHWVTNDSDEDRMTLICCLR